MSLCPVLVFLPSEILFPSFLTLPPVYLLALKDTRSYSLEPVNVLCGKRNSAGVIKGFEMGGCYPGLSEWALSAITIVLLREKEKKISLHRIGKGDVQMEQREI